MTARDAQPAPRNKLAAACVLAAVFVFAAAIRSDAWWVFSQAFSPRSFSYRQLRIDEGFKGLPIDALADAIDRRLPRDAPLALGPELRDDARWSQRLTEGLYPRRIVDAAHHRLRLDKVADEALVSFPDNGFFHLDGPAIVHPPETPANPHTTFSLVRLFLALAGVAGWGVFALFIVARVRRRDTPHGSESLAIAIGSVTLQAYLSIALLAHVLTLLQFPWFAMAVVGPGLLALALVIARVNWRTLLGNAGVRFRDALTEPGAWLYVAAMVIGLRTSFLLPILGWDGRSIWFFRAHQIAQQGMFALGDAILPGNEFAHPSYPLAFPAWLAAFGGGGDSSSLVGVFGERQAASGIAVLLAGLLTLLFGLLQRRTSRAVAAAFCVGSFLVAYPAAASGYPDPFVAILLCVGALGLADPEHRAFALSALAAASLTKREGLLFGAILLAGFSTALAKPAFPTVRARVLAFAVFVPALLHAVWARFHDLPDPYQRSALPATPSALGHRLVQIADHTLNLFVARPALLFAAAGIVMALALPRRIHPSEDGRRVALVALLCSAAVVLVFVTSPFNLDWHLNTALHRLLSTLALLGAMSAVLRLAPTTDARS